MYYPEIRDIWSLYDKIWQKHFFFSKPIFWPPTVPKSKKVAIFSKKWKNAIFESKLPKMTQMGWKSPKINFNVLSNFLSSQILIFWFFPILWSKLAEILPKNGIFAHFWQKNLKVLGNKEKYQNSAPTNLSQIWFY